MAEEHNIFPFFKSPWKHHSEKKFALTASSLITKTRGQQCSVFEGVIDVLDVIGIRGGSALILNSIFVDHLYPSCWCQRHLCACRNVNGCTFLYYSTIVQYFTVWYWNAANDCCNRIFRTLMRFGTIVDQTFCRIVTRTNCQSRKMCNHSNFLIVCRAPQHSSPSYFSFRK